MKYSIAGKFVFALLFVAGAAQAGTLTWYANRGTFNDAQPGLPVQSFDSANLFGQTVVWQAIPLNSATHDAVFAAGSILRGLTLSTQQPGSRSNALTVYKGGPLATVNVGNSWFGDTLLLKFNPAVSAVATNVFGNTSYGPSFAGKISVQFYNGSKILGGKTFNEAYGGYIFIGVSSATLPITKAAITWASDEDASTYVSDIAFGTPP
jgi:hypothetical protein